MAAVCTQEVPAKALEIDSFVEHFVPSSQQTNRLEPSLAQLPWCIGAADGGRGQCAHPCSSTALACRSVIQPSSQTVNARSTAAAHTGGRGQSAAASAAGSRPAACSHGKGGGWGTGSEAQRRREASCRGSFLNVHHVSTDVKATLKKYEAVNMRASASATRDPAAPRSQAVARAPAPVPVAWARASSAATWMDRGMRPTGRGLPGPGAAAALAAAAPGCLAASGGGASATSGLEIS
jgi:hypothetical protein